MKNFDIKGNELNVGDDVAFTSSGYIRVGYIYKIEGGKVYMTQQPKGQRPYPDGHKYCDSDVTGPDHRTVIGRRSYFIHKLEGTYGNTRS